MAILRLCGGIVDITGSFAGSYFHRDKYGIHLSSKPRHVQQLTPAQRIQRNAFITARAFSHDPRFVSYNIYRVLNGLPPQAPPPEYQIPNLQGPE